MKRNQTNILLSCAIILLAGAVLTVGQENKIDPKNKKVSIKMDKQSLGKVFGELMLKYDIAIGFEESIFDRNHDDYEFETKFPKPKPERQEQKNKNLNADEKMRVSMVVERIFDVKKHWITINAENSRLEDVLNSIVGQMGNYKWEINDDVVNIYPVQGQDKRFEELLKLPIKEYQVSKRGWIGLVRYRILDLPEIKEFLAKNNLHFSTIRADPENTDLPIDIDLDFSDLTFRELLNKITKAKRGGWILKHNKIIRQEEKEYIEISI